MILTSNINWLGRERSNLRMAESKSDEYAKKINDHSEFSSSVHPLTALANFPRTALSRPLLQSAVHVPLFGRRAVTAGEAGDRGLPRCVSRHHHRRRRTEEIWLSGVAPSLRQKMFQEPSSSSDYLDLFKPAAPWQKTSQRVKVFMTNGGLILRESDAVLQAVFAELKRRNTAPVIEMGLLTGKDSSGQQACGVEGFGAPDTARVIAERIKKNGGELRYVAMDEPLFFGHHFKGKNACKWSMNDVARDIAPRVAVLRGIFPSIEIGDVEPIGATQICLLTGSTKSLNGLKSISKSSDRN
jgi:hypothetical protein